MNKINLLKAVYFLYTQVPSERFDMREYRTGDKENPICDSVGCACGHLTAIIPEDKIIRFSRRNSINFYFTTRNILDIDDAIWGFLFAGDYTIPDNTIEGVCQRILYILTTEKPDLVIKFDPPYKKINVLKTYNKLKSRYEKFRKL